MKHTVDAKNNEETGRGLDQRRAKHDATGVFHICMKSSDLYFCPRDSFRRVRQPAVQHAGP